MIFVRDCTIDGAKLKRIRERAGFSLSQVSEAVGLTQRSAISKIERTGRTTSDVLVRMLRLYEVYDVRRILLRRNGKRTTQKEKR